MGSLEVARLCGRLRAARHTLREVYAHPQGEMWSIVRHRQFCDLCCQRITVGRAMLSWLWGSKDGSVLHVTVHPDCLRIYDVHGGDRLWGSYTWDDLVAGHHGLTRAELLAEIDACQDPDVAATLRKVAAERAEHGWDEVDDA